MFSSCRADRPQPYLRMILVDCATEFSIYFSLVNISTAFYFINDMQSRSLGCRPQKSFLFISNFHFSFAGSSNSVLPSSREEAIFVKDSWAVKTSSNTLQLEGGSGVSFSHRFPTSIPSSDKIQFATYLSSTAHELVTLPLRIGDYLSSNFYKTMFQANRNYRNYFNQVNLTDFMRHSSVNAIAKCSKYEGTGGQQ